MRLAKLARSQALLVAEDVRELGEGQRCALSQVIEGDVDLVGGLDEAQHVLLGREAQSACLLGEFIEILAACPGIDLLELLVEVLHLLGGHSRELAHGCHLGVYLGIDLHSGLARHHQSRHGGCRAHDCCLPVVDGAVEALPETLLGPELGVDLGEFSLHGLDLGHVRVPGRAAPFHVVQLAVEGLQGLVQFLGCRLVQAAHHGLDLLGRGLDFTDLAFGVGQFPSQLAEFDLVAAGGGLGDGVLQFHGPLLELLQDLLGLHAVDR